MVLQAPGTSNTHCVRAAVPCLQTVCLRDQLHRQAGIHRVSTYNQGAKDICAFNALNALAQ